MGSSFDLGFSEGNQRILQQRQLAEQQRVQNQNKTGALLLDSINNASNIKPPTDPQTIVDEASGKTIPNPVYLSKQKAYDDAQKAKADLHAQYVQLMSPAEHASFGQRLHGLIFGTPTEHSQQPALSTNSKPVAPMADPNQPAPVAPPPDPTAPGGGVDHPLAAASPDHPLHAITKGISALGNHLKAFAQPLSPPAHPVDPAEAAKYYADPTQVAFERQKELQAGHWASNLDVAEERTKALLAGKPPRPVGDFITLPHLIEQMRTDPDMSVVGPDGHHYSPEQIAELPDGFLAHAYMKGNEVLFGFGDPKTKEWHIGNAVIQVPTYGQVNSDNTTNLGVANPGAVSTHQVPGMNPGEVINLTNTRTPATTGMTPTPATGAPITPPANPVLQRRPDNLAAPVPPVSQSTNPGARAPGTIPVGGAVKTPKLAARPMEAGPMSTSAQAITAGINGKPVNNGSTDPTTYLAKHGVYPDPPPPFAKGTMLTQGKTTKPIVAKADAVAANIFGGGDEKPIWNNAGMFDNPALRTALNTALTMNALATPGTADDPTLMQQLATSVGATAWSQQQINAASVQAKDDLLKIGGPEALKMFARMAGMQEDLTALRAVTGGSAAASTIKTMVRAAPVYNVSSAQNFRDQLGATLNTAAKALHAYPEINPAYVKWWNDGAQLARQGTGPVSANAPKSLPPPRPAGVPANAKWDASRNGGKGSWVAP